MVQSYSTQNYSTPNLNDGDTGIVSVGKRGAGFDGADDSFMCGEQQLVVGLHRLVRFEEHCTRHIRAVHLVSSALRYNNVNDGPTAE